MKLLLGKSNPDSYLAERMIEKAFIGLGYEITYNINDDIVFGFIGEGTKKPHILPLKKRDYPIAIWDIDSYDRSGNIKHAPADYSPEYDVIFCSVFDHIKHRQKNFPQDVHYLTFGLDPEINFPMDIRPFRDTVFVGHHWWGRHKYLQMLSTGNYKDVYIHDSRSNAPSGMIHPKFVGSISDSRLNRYLNESKIIFNYSTQAGLGMRVYQGLGVGRMVLTNRKGSDPDVLFEDGVHLVAYDNMGDCKKKFEYYLEENNERSKIAHTGYKEAINKHTWVHRAREVEEILLEKRNEI